jgi:hypothetical protein
VQLELARESSSALLRLESSGKKLDAHGAHRGHRAHPVRRRASAILIGRPGLRNPHDAPSRGSSSAHAARLSRRSRLPAVRLPLQAPSSSARHGGKVSIEHLSASKGGAARRWRNCSASRPWHKGGAASPWQKGSAASPWRRQVHNDAVTLPAAVARCCSKVHKNPTLFLMIQIQNCTQTRHKHLTKVVAKTISSKPYI